MKLNESQLRSIIQQLTEAPKKKPKSKAPGTSMSPEVKRVLKQLKVPSGGDYYALDGNWSWQKKSGHAGAKVISRVIQAAEAAGWTRGEQQQHGIPDGSVMGSSNEMHSPEGHKLSWYQSYGSTSYDNWFELKVKFAKSQTNESMELSELIEPFEPDIVNQLRTVGDQLDRMAFSDDKYDAAFDEISGAHKAIKQLIAKLKTLG